MMATCCDGQQPEERKIMTSKKRNAVELELLTTVRWLRYDVQRQCGMVQMDEGCCTDVGGTIDLFQRIDPAVRQIETWADQEPDIVYVKLGARWQAYDR